jgi:hypothetical protein
MKRPMPRFTAPVAGHVIANAHQALGMVDADVQAVLLFAHLLAGQRISMRSRLCALSWRSA